MPVYLIDSNVFIEAKDRHYGFDFCPAFWDWLVAQNRVGRVASIDEVACELLRRNDELASWAIELGDEFFLRPDEEVYRAVQAVSNWAGSEGYRDQAIETFMDGADCWLVAHALAHECTVVTHEIGADTDRKIKIPNACAGVDVNCISPFEMLRREQARFVLR